MAFLLMLAWFTLVEGQCPHNWQGFGENCYMVSDKEASWAGAMAACKGKGGQLAAVGDLDTQLFVANLVKSSDHKSTVTQNTGNDYVYHYLHDLGVDVTKHTSVIFTVQACNDAHIALSQVKGLDTQQTYEIVIGGWADSQSVIRDCKQCQHMDTAHHSSHPIDCNAAKPFWISWSNNYIRVGTGNSVGENQFMSWNDTDPHVINYVAVATGWGATGVWTFMTDSYWPGKFWIGASDLAAENEWLWLPSQTQVSEYTNWASGEPNNQNGYQHCMAMDMRSDFQWRDDTCEENRNYICERPMDYIGEIVG